MQRIMLISYTDAYRSPVEVGCAGSLSAAWTKMAPDGHAAAHSSQPMQRSRPSAWRYSRWRPRNAGGKTRLTSGYEIVMGGAATCRKVVQNPLARPRAASNTIEISDLQTWPRPVSR